MLRLTDLKPSFAGLHTDANKISDSTISCLVWTHESVNCNSVYWNDRPVAKCRYGTKRRPYRPPAGQV